MIQKLIWGVSGALAAALGVIAVSSRPFFIINESRSLPRGLYLRSTQPIEHGATVMLEQPERARAYLAELGMPSDLPLLKRITAVGGDAVCASAGEITTPQGVTKAALYDRRNTRLPQWSDCRKLEADEVFVLGDSPDSFDSRYFGPVRQTALRGVFVQIVRW